MKIFKLILISVLLFALLMAGLTGCGSKAEDQAVPAGENTVLIEDYKYNPAEITIKTGETITWINKDSVRHTATGDNFDTGLFGKDESAQVTFDEAGTFDYICTPHPYMKGKVIIEE